MNIRYFRLLPLLLAVVLVCGCKNKNKVEVKFHRFDQMLFTTPTDKMAAYSDEYNSKLINFKPQDTGYMAMLTDFLSDTVVQDIYHVTDSLYHDLSDVEKQLGAALTRAAKLCPEMKRYTRFYTLVTADYDEYAFRVFVNDTDLAISLDQYALGAMEKYGYFGMPNYILGLCTKEHIAPDCMAAIAATHTKWHKGKLTLLDCAIADGKSLYFVEKTMPKVHDSIIIRYTGDQLAWMNRNMEQVWSWLIDNNLLYSTDLSQLQNLMDEAPKTNAFGDGSAPRTPSYIGWQIVRSYMKKTGASMEELLNETDSQKILTVSGWRP